MENIISVVISIIDEAVGVPLYNEHDRDRAIKWWNEDDEEIKPLLHSAFIAKFKDKSEKEIINVFIEENENSNAIIAVIIKRLEFEKTLISRGFKGLKFLSILKFLISGTASSYEIADQGWLDNLIANEKKLEPINFELMIHDDYDNKIELDGVGLIKREGNKLTAYEISLDGCSDKLIKIEPKITRINKKCPAVSRFEKIQYYFESINNVKDIKIKERIIEFMKIMINQAKLFSKQKLDELSDGSELLEWIQQQTAENLVVDIVVRRDYESEFEDIINKARENIRDFDDKQEAFLNECRRDFAEGWRIIRDRLADAGIKPFEIKEGNPIINRKSEVENGWTISTYTGDKRGEADTIAEFGKYDSGKKQLGVKIGKQTLVWPVVSVF